MLIKFERGIEPKQSLEIGMAAKARKLTDKIQFIKVTILDVLGNSLGYSNFNMQQVRDFKTGKNILEKILNLTNFWRPENDKRSYSLEFRRYYGDGQNSTDCFHYSEQNWLMEYYGYTDEKFKEKYPWLTIYCLADDTF